MFDSVKFDDNKAKIIIDSSLYAKESIVSTCYKFSDVFYVRQYMDAGSIVVELESKKGSAVTEECIMRFHNELIDQQVRYNTNQQFGHIRDLIVEEAFKPVNK